ncbi:hypothetical protein [Glycomyces xiaoerkulensis]|uniref:hypothetical protein n=1 Tax=Glycomyces xiaoerkulensis TaxID=2038139 RepID=UPI000C25B3FC|nr:hypothetical protein [Glycomyces xiaoerkulensis]
MTHPENRPPEEDDDGGTFKLRPGGQSEPEPQQQDGIDSTMKLRKTGGGNPAAPGGAPPPPPSPLGQPTGPANPQNAHADTSVMPQSGGSQTGFQPSAPPPPGQPGGPLAQGSPPPPQGQPPYGQQPGGGQAPPQPPYGPPPGGAAGAVPSGVKRIGLLALIAGGVSLVNVIINIAFAGAETGVMAVPGLLFALAVLGYGITLPRGMLSSKGPRLTGIILMMIQGGFGLIGLLGLLGIMSLISGGVLALSLAFLVAVVGADAWATFIYFKDHEAHAWIMGSAARPRQAGGAAPPPGAPGPQGPPQQGHPQQPGRPGAYGPPPGYQQGGQPGQPPYGR